MSFWATFAAMMLFALPGAMGVLVLLRLDLGLSSLELVSYGIPTGVVGYSLLLLIGSSLWGLNGWTVWVPLVFCVIGIALLVGLHPGSIKREALVDFGASGRRSVSGDWKRWIPMIVVGLFLARWVWFWSQLFEVNSAGLWIHQANVWADWARHFGDAASFVFSDNLPPTEPRYLGHPFAYHYLVSITAAAMAWFGLDLVEALSLQSLLLTLLITLGLYAFFKRLARDNWIAALGLTLFFLGGGLGWWVLLTHSPDFASVLDSIAHSPWNRALVQEPNIQFQNVFFSLISPQRPFLYGLPLGLLVFTLLNEGIGEKRVAPFAVAGVVAGLLPLAHLGTLLVLALVTPFLFLLFYSWRWWVFVITWAGVGLPQFLLQQGGEGGVLKFMRLQLGWLAGEDAWLWFWFKNLGLFMPLVVIALLMRGSFERIQYRFLLAFMPLFVIVNVVVFQPWAWDSTKFLMYWFLAACLLVAGLLVRMWRSRWFPGARAVAVAITLTLVLSGVWEHLGQGLGNDRNLFLTREEIDLSAAVIAETPPRSIFAVGLQHNHPVPVMTGRQVLMSYPGWLWSHGIDYGERERDLQSIYALDSRAASLIEEYGIDFVVVGPAETSSLGADRVEFRKRYPTLVQTENYDVFAIKAASPETP